MGTNYYIRENICNNCNRYDEQHIWKSSMWRDFIIHHNKKDYNSWSEFQKYLKWKKIFTEYGEEVKLKTFIDLLQFKKSKYPFRHKKEDDPHWIYIDWFYFLDVEFC